MKKIAIFLLVGLLPASGYAECTGNEQRVLECTFKKGRNAVSVCISGDAILYEYGKRGAKPDLRLIENIKDVEHLPWPGVGSSIWNETTFYNGEYSYAIYMSMDRMSEEHPIYAGISVAKAGKELARLDCDQKNLKIGLFEVSDTKKQFGQCWNLDQEKWQACAD